MKKTILFVVVFSFGICCFAQEHIDSSKWKNQFKIAKLRWLSFYAWFGIDINSVGGQDESYDQALVGGEAGVGFPIVGFNEHTGLGGELEYGMRGSKYHDYGTDGKVVLSYIMAPVFIRHDFNGGFFAEAGMQPAVLVTAKDKYQGQSYSYKSSINTFDLGALGGIGYTFKRRAGVGLRYSRSITNINKDGSAKDHNSTFALRFLWYLIH